MLGKQKLLRALCSIMSIIYVCLEDVFDTKDHERNNNYCLTYYLHNDQGF